jgi:SAM-dependent methyltransferase
MSPLPNSSDLAGRPYWDQVWRRSGARPVGRFAYSHRCLAAVFLTQTRAGMSVCEVGCADSVWVPFLIQHGMTVSGLDYSERGIERLQSVLKGKGLQAELFLGDLFDSSVMPRGRHDFVFSLGLVEHFTDGIAAVRALGDLLKPGGTLLTVVPNLTGTWGAVQKRLDRSVYEVHLRYTPASLDDLHRRAGMEAVEAARYFGGFGPLVMNAPRVADSYPRLHRAGVAAVWLVQQAIAWPAGLLLGRRSESRLFSSHIVGVYRRRE